jgi:Family of unknown function (DUF6093)
MAMLEATLAGRALAEVLMVDECAVTRHEDEAGTWDEAAGDFVIPPGSTTTVYLGPCKVQTRQAAIVEADVGERQVGIVRWEIHLPVTGSEDVARGDTVTVTASVLDDALVGRQFTVTGPFVGTAKTARRLPVEALA